MGQISRMSATHAFLLAAPPQCWTTRDLHQAMRGKTLLPVSRVRTGTELRELAASQAVVQPVRHYYCLAAQQDEAREAHIRLLVDYLANHGAAYRQTVIRDLGVSASFLSWLLRGVGNRVHVLRRDGREVLELGQGAQTVMFAPHTLEIVRERLRYEATKAIIRKRELGLQELTVGLNRTIKISKEAVHQYVQHLETLGEVALRTVKTEMASICFVASLPALLFPAPVVAPVVALPAVVGLPLVTPLPARPAPTRHQQVLLTAALGRPKRTLPLGVSAPVVTPLFPEAHGTPMMAAAPVLSAAGVERPGDGSGAMTPLVSVPVWEVRTSPCVVAFFELERPQARGTPGLHPRHPQPIHDAA